MWVTRRKRRNKGDGLMQVYPSSFAKKDIRRRAKEQLRRFDGDTSEAEPNQVNCAQCNAYIIDSTRIEDCWNCGSDNFLGRPKWPQRR